MWFLVLWALGIISAVVHMFIVGFPEAIEEISRIVLLYQFIVTFGLVGLIGTYINIFDAENTAKKLGWPGGLFQIKYGFSQLGIGVMGILAIWLHGNFWAATLVTMYIYGLSGLWSHTSVMIKEKKVSAMELGNIIMDICYQGFITALSIIAGGIWVR